MEKLTVFTPTYNRAYCLHQCYESLCRQTNQNFKWLIIDDGSIDKTKELIQAWMKEEKLSIHYVYQQNQGMHGAHNTAYELIETELNVCLDSDDYLADDAVEQILIFWKKYGSEEVSGIACLNANTNGKLIGTKLPDIPSATLYDIYNKYEVKGDKKLVYRTALMNMYRYPLFEKERYVGLDYKYLKLDEKYPLLLFNHIVCYVDYQMDGSSNTMLRQYKKNPAGFTFYRKELMQLSQASTLFKFRQAVHYVSSSLFMKNTRFLMDTPKKILTLAAIPAGLVLTGYIQLKTLKS